MESRQHRDFFCLGTVLFMLFGLMVPISAFSTGQLNHRVKHGTTFLDSSKLLGDYQHSGGEGLAGVAWLDYDADRDLDLLLTNGVGTSNGLFRNNGDGTFTDVTNNAGLSNVAGNSAVVVGDIDNDGYPDIFMSGTGRFFGPGQTPTKLFHNNGNGTFSDISASANVPGGQSALSAAMADINNDGYLDLFVTANGHLGIFFPPGEQHTDRLYLNNGDLTFTDITEKAKVAGGQGSCVASFSDYDRDGWMDLYVGVCNDIEFAPTPFHLYRNNHDNTFTDVASQAGLNDQLGYWMSIAFGDIDNDGLLDLFSTNSNASLDGLGLAPHMLLHNNGDGTYSNITSPEMRQNEFSWGSTFADFDNDGYVDLFFTGSFPAFGIVGPGLGNPGRLFFNQGNKTFIQDNLSHGLDLSLRYSSGLAQADYNGDGFADLVIATAPYEARDRETGDISFVNPNGSPVLLRNDGNENNWITVRLIGTKSNAMGVGALIELFTEGSRGNYQVREVRAGGGFASSETPWPTFGLGKHRLAWVKVNWPSGRVDWFKNLKINTFVDLVEGQDRHGHSHGHGHSHKGRYRYKGRHRHRHKGRNSYGRNGYKDRYRHKGSYR